VGKTLLTALLLAHLRRRNLPAYALKPFCSGSRSDAKLLHALQHAELSLDEINPFFYRAPLAPGVAAGREGGLVAFDRAIEHILRLKARLSDDSVLLVEGVGGLLVPLGKDYTVLDLLLALPCEVLVVASNHLGTINHTLLTLRALAAAAAAPPMSTKRDRLPAPKSNNRRASGVETSPDFAACKTILMNPARSDLSSRSNLGALRALLPGPVFSVPYLGPGASLLERVVRGENKMKKTLARILG
jgi:dethiobiotin synthase